MDELETLRRENRHLKSLLTKATELLSKSKEFLANTTRPVVRKKKSSSKRRRGPR
jgi:hypothetical protein